MCKSNKTQKECLTKDCLNKAVKGRAYCHKCRKNQWRKKHPLKASYSAHKFNAKRRGIESNLTFEEYKELALKFEVVTKDGEIKELYHLDRIDATKGYSVDNCRFITQFENCSKATADKQQHFEKRLKEFGIIQAKLIFT